jgi:phosphopantothenoylcysteine synthetase/decarboxylase
LETENALENAKKKFKDGGMDILIVNTATCFKENFIEYGFLTRDDRETKLTRSQKEWLAIELFREVNYDDDD